MRSPFLFVSLLLVGCRAPDDALTARCTNEVLGTGDPQHCEVFALVLDGTKRITLDTSRSYGRRRRAPHRHHGSPCATAVFPKNVTFTGPILLDANSFGASRVFASMLALPYRRP